MSFVGVSGGSTPAPGNLVVMGAVQCTDDLDDTDDMEFLLHPLGFRIDGVHAAGAIVGNFLLCGVVALLFCVVVLLLQTTGAGSKRDAPLLTPFMKAGSVIRFPSVMLPLPLLLIAGILQASFDIVFHPRDSTLVNVIGWSGLAVSLGFTGIMYKTSTPPSAVVRGIPRGKIGRYCLAEGLWVSSTPLSVERHGLIYDIYRDLPWVRGKYFALETAYLYPLTMLSAIRSNDWSVCTAKVLALAAIFFAMTLVIWMKDIFLAKFLKHIMLGSNMLMVMGLLLYAVAYTAQDMQHWAADVGMLFFFGAMVLSLVRALYDLITYVMEIVAAAAANRERRRKAAVDKSFLSQLGSPESGTSMGSLELEEVSYGQAKERGRSMSCLSQTSSYLPPQCESPEEETCKSLDDSKKSLMTPVPAMMLGSAYTDDVALGDTFGRGSKRRLRSPMSSRGATFLENRSFDGEGGLLGTSPNSNASRTHRHLLSPVTLPPQTPGRGSRYSSFSSPARKKTTLAAI